MVVAVSLPPELRRKLSSLPSIKTVVEQIGTFESQTEKKNNKKPPDFINSTRCLRMANILFLFN